MYHSQTIAFNNLKKCADKLHSMAMLHILLVVDWSPLAYSLRLYQILTLVVKYIMHSATSYHSELNIIFSDQVSVLFH